MHQARLFGNAHLGRERCVRSPCSDSPCGNVSLGHGASCTANFTAALGYPEYTHHNPQNYTCSCAPPFLRLVSTVSTSTDIFGVVSVINYNYGSGCAYVDSDDCGNEDQPEVHGMPGGRSGGARCVAGERYDVNGSVVVYNNTCVDGYRTKLDPR